MVSKTALASVTAIIVAMISAMTVLVWHGSDITQIGIALGFVAPTVASILNLKVSENIASKGDERAKTLDTLVKQGDVIVRQTNGITTSLIAKLPDQTPKHAAEGTENP